MGSPTHTVCTRCGVRVYTHLHGMMGVYSTYVVWWWYVVVYSGCIPCAYPYPLDTPGSATLFLTPSRPPDLTPISDPVAGGDIYTTRARVGRRHKRFWRWVWDPGIWASDPPS